MKLHGALTFVQALLGLSHAPHVKDVEAARKSWRDAIHQTNNGAQRAVATAHEDSKTSAKALAVLSETLRRQEEIASLLPRETAFEALAREMRSKQ